MISVSKLTKTFNDLKRGSVPALNAVSFEVRPGEVFGLLGPNGAGKTTCLRILSTVLRSTGGTAVIAGYDVNKNPAQVRSRIGFMSNNTGVYDRMTAWEMVEYFGQLYDLEGEQLRERMHSVFATLQMNDFKDLLCAKMSTGMKQKVSIARTIIHDPPVMIFDEPTSGLDVLVARNVVDAIRKLRDSGKTIIYSTHIMSEVEKLCDRVGIIHKGSILAMGSRTELCDQHNEHDIEQLFFKLVDQYDGLQASIAV